MLSPDIIIIMKNTGKNKLVSENASFISTLAWDCFPEIQTKY